MSNIVVMKYFMKFIKKQKKWVRKMNNIKESVEELVLKEYIFV